MPVASCVATGTACGRHPLAAGARGVSLPPKPPIPSPARFYLELFTFEKGETRSTEKTARKHKGYPSTARNGLFTRLETGAISPVERVTAAPHEREEKQLSRPSVFRLHCRPASSPLPPLAADAACRGREGDPGRPQGGRSAAAGADITPATGRGRFAPMPHAARGGRGRAQLRRQISRSRKKGSTGVQGV